MRVVIETGNCCIDYVSISIFRPSRNSVAMNGGRFVGVISRG